MNIILFIIFSFILILLFVVCIILGGIQHQLDIGNKQKEQILKTKQSEGK